MNRNSDSYCFKPYSENSSLRIQEVKNELIFKYLPIRHFLSSYFRNEVFLANPNTWPDPFEQNYRTHIKNKQDGGEDKDDFQELRDYYPFATCFASELINEQASWNAYVKGNEPVVRVAINYDNFLNELSKYKCGENERIYISKMEYKQRGFILTPQPLERNDEEYNWRDLYIRNFSLKQNAYEFEGEIRLTLLTSIDEQDKSSHCLTGINWLKFIDHITLPPVFGGNDEEIKKKKKVLKMTIDPSIKLYKSTLYEIKHLTEERIW